MSKQQAHKRKQHNQPMRRQRGLVIVGCLMVAGTLIGGTFAQWRTGPSPQAALLTTATTTAMVTTSPTPLALAKEYVYAGGRLIATEEPAPQATPTPTPSPTPLPCTPPTGVIISEFRLRGANSADSARDEFVELYNTNSTPITICTADGSAGWALAAADGATRFVVPSGTVIPARGHYLGVNSGGYSLGAYGSGAAGDASYTTDIPDDSGIALFNTATPANFISANRLDAVGCTATANTLYREGAGLAPVGSAAGEYSFIRKLVTGLPQDTNDNAPDFAFASPTASAFSGVQSQLGAPGPENLASPIQRNATINPSVIDPAVASTVAPNRVRLTTANVCGTGNCALGTLTIRRKFTNNTGQPVTRLRFRVVDITTLNSPGYTAGGGQSDMRLLDSANVTVTLTGGTQVQVLGTVVEQPPPQTGGGGMNSSVTITIPGGTLAPGASVNVQFVLGVQQGGSYRFTVNTEALP